MDNSSGWLVYEIDDLMFDGTCVCPEKLDYIKQKYGDRLSDIGIPKFNHGRKAFEGAEIQKNNKQKHNSADFVTDTKE